MVGGHGDPPLAPDGIARAEAVAQRLRHRRSAPSPSPRCNAPQTAAPLARLLGITPGVEADLREIFLGEWEGGLLRQKGAENDPVYLRMQAEQDWGVIPGAESVAALQARCEAAVARIHAAHPDERVAVFVHGGVIAALCARATGAKAFAFNGADNGSIHHLVVLGDEWKLRCYNDTGHLGHFTARAQPLT
ncbi:MAG: histidine phosphatase family protein [Acidimicrobiales bacterium]